MKHHLNSGLFNESQLVSLIRFIDKEVVDGDVEFCVFSNFEQAQEYFSKRSNLKDLSEYLEDVKNGVHLGAFISNPYNNSFTPIVALFEFNIIKRSVCPKVEMIFNLFHELRHYKQYLSMETARFNDDALSDWKEQDANHYAYKKMLENASFISKLTSIYNWNVPFFKEPEKTEEMFNAV